ncbi:MAG: shikimate dehydrogenase [Oscillospiraceae bacterium]|jgi:shikimate dehydrogenase|nr:shikimate dehydrogenase [Oscillospiraceae bacterium]
MSAKKYGLIGYPLGHSISPLIHSEIFMKTSCGGEYSLYEIKPGEFDVLSSLEGFNVTIPYKELIITYCDKLDRSADCGAVNCVKGKTGYNTDVYGFEKAIKALGADLGSRVCLLGYGGAGKMVAHTVKKAGGELTVATRENINELKGEFDLLVNSTPVGMHPNADFSPIDFENISANFVLDLIYNPAETTLLSPAKIKGAKVQNGLIMLVWQAIKSHEIWYGGKLSEDDADEIIKTVQKTAASLS